MFFENILKHITPNNQSIVIYDSELKNYTYAKLYSQICKVEELYKSKKLERNNIVILHFDKSFYSLAYLLCCIKMGIIYIPIDVNTPKKRLEIIKKTSKANAIISNDFSIHLLDKTISPTEKYACCVLYTSGSTGIPKGVVISEKSLTEFTKWSSQEFSITSDDIITSYAPFHFDLSTFDIFTSLLNGASIWLINNKLSANFRLLGEHLKIIKPTVWYATPTVYNLLNQYGNLNPDYQPKIALFAGEIFNINDLNSLRKTWNQTTFYNLYGPTETNVCTYFKLPKQIENKKENYPIGIACPYAKLKISETNELLVSGKSVMLSYLNEPFLTQEKFITINDEKWLKSGDIVELKNDLIYYKTRNDRMIKKNGYRIELFEIENELINHPDIHHVACTFNNNKITAFYTGNKCSSLILKTYSSQQLLNYMVPNQFFHIDSLPINSNGKIDYAQLIKYL